MKKSLRQSIASLLLGLIAVVQVSAKAAPPEAESKLTGIYETATIPTDEFLKIDGKLVRKLTQRREILELRADRSMLWIHDNGVTDPLVKTGAWATADSLVILYWLSPNGHEGAVRICPISDFRAGIRLKFKTEETYFYRTSKPLPDRLYDEDLVLSALDRLLKVLQTLPAEPEFLGADDEASLKREFFEAIETGDANRLVSLTYPIFQQKRPDHYLEIYQHWITTVLFPGETIGYDEKSAAEVSAHLSVLKGLGSRLPKTFVPHGSLSPMKQVPGTDGYISPGGAFYGTVDGRWFLVISAYSAKELKKAGL